MSHAQSIALLKEALDFLNDRPSFGLRSNPHLTSYQLASRIDGHLKRIDFPSEPHRAVAVAADLWTNDDHVSIDDGETEVSEGADGVWVRAWILVDHDDLPPDDPPAGSAAIDPIAYLGAFEELPRLTRTIFRLHRVDGLDYPVIAARLSISVDEVCAHIATAIAHLDQRLGV
jgi:hypothetical protein